MIAARVHNQLFSAHDTVKTLDFVSEQIMNLVLDSTQIAFRTLFHFSSSLSTSTDTVYSSASAAQQVIDGAFDSALQFAEMGSNLPWKVGSLFTTIKEPLQQCKQAVAKLGTTVESTSQQLKQVADLTSTFCSSISTSVAQVQQIQDYEQVKQVIDSFKEENKELATANDKLVSIVNQHNGTYPIVTKAAVNLLQRACNITQTISNFAQSSNQMIKQFVKQTEPLLTSLGNTLTQTGRWLSIVPFPFIQAVGVVCQMVGSGLRHASQLPNVTQKIENLAIVAQRSTLKATAQVLKRVVEKEEPLMENEADQILETEIGMIRESQ